MGAWGYGLLQNDAAQDGLVEVIQTVEEEIASLAGRRANEGTAARLGAAIGILLQLSSWHSFDPENEVSAKVLEALRRHEPQGAALPPKARRLLRDVAGGEGQDLAARPMKLSQSLRRALLATPLDEFPTERVFGKRESSLFVHPAAARYVQRVANWCVARVDEDFADEDVAGDLPREAEGMGAFATLFVLGPCRVPVKKVARWQKAYHQAVAGPKADGSMDEFEQEYEKCLDLAFRLLVKKFSTE